MIPPPNPDNCLYLGQVVDNQVCTIEGTLYGYEPDLGANAFFAGFFALCFVWQLFCGIRYKTWTYMVSQQQQRFSTFFDDWANF
jgi:hypothetical protein